MRRIALITVLAAALAGACGADEATQVLVWVAVEEGSQVEARAAALAVEVQDQDGQVTLAETRVLGSVSLPASISLVPKGGDAKRHWRVAVSLVDAGGAAFATERAEGTFVAHELREVWLRFTDACDGVSCGIGRTCIDGACERACFAPRPEGSTSPSTPGPCPCDCRCTGDRCEDGRCIPTTAVARVAAGHDHACAVDGDGALSCWGSNVAGQLGVGDLETRDRPTRVDLPGPVRAVAASARHTCAILEDGSAYCWGANESGQLGVEGGDVTTPAPVTTGEGTPLGELVDVGAGVQHSCAARADGTLFCWGDDATGQLGVGNFGGPPRRPTEVEAPPSAEGGLTRVSLGEAHTCSLQNVGRLWCWGRNNDGPLGLGDQTDRNLPELVEVPEGAESWSAVTTGAWHTCGLVQDGALYCWGAITEGRLGIDSPDDLWWPTRVMEELDFHGLFVAAGRRHTCAIQDDGSLWCMGIGLEGEIGVGDAVPDPPAPVQLRDAGWESLALGDSFTCGLRAGGTLWCWGAGAIGQLALGDRDGRREPARVCWP